MPSIIAAKYGAFLTDANRTGASNDIAVPDTGGLVTRTAATGDTIVDLVEIIGGTGPDPTFKIAVYLVTEDGDWLPVAIAAGDLIVGTALEAGTQSASLAVVLNDGETIRTANWGRNLTTLADVGRAITTTVTP